MSWHKLESGAEVCFGDIPQYFAAIHAAPPGTVIKMGDLEVTEMVQCTTCGARMEPRAADFHTHPVECLACHVTFDANLVRHEPLHVERPVGAGTIGHAAGCNVVTL